MLAGLPVEMLTMLGSSLLGGMMTIWGQKAKERANQQKMLLARGKFQMDEINKAREFDNKGFQWTRRIIALTAVFFIIAFPKLVPVFTDVNEVVMDKVFNGVIITPLDTHLMSAIIGLYFGGSLVKK